MYNYIIENQLFPCVNYFKILAKCTNILIESCEAYPKSSFRNRYIIYGSNGLIQLSIPVRGGRDQKAFFKDIEIDYSEHWQLKHWRSLVSSYKNSPYFDYYEPALKSIIFSKETYLYDYNINVLKWIISLLKLQIEISFTSEYKKLYENIVDYRGIIRPNNYQFSDEGDSIKYHQIFEDRHGFYPNLSILDMIFNCGPSCVQFLKVVK